MSVTYTNRKGVTCTLYLGTSKTGKPRYYFGRGGGEGEPVAELPPGHSISESVNAVVSLVKDRPSPLRPAEVAAVEAVIRRHPKAKNYRVVAKGRRIEIYERTGGDYVDTFAELGIFGLTRDQIAARLGDLEERRARFEPVLRLTLLDREQRRFGAARMCYLSRIDGWLDLSRWGSAAELADALVPTLGTDDFFELW
jgi:hypothetical protein